MKGHPDVIDYLKDLLRGELAARDQYFVHSRRYEDLGLQALYERINHEMEEETQHADALLRRILFLEGDPDMNPKSFEQGRTVEEMLSKDLALEYEVREKLAMIRPLTLGQAGRIEGMTPGALTALLAHVKKAKGVEADLAAVVA